MTHKDLACNEMLDTIIHVLNSVHGLDISPFDETFVWKAVEKRCLELGLETDEVYGKYLAGCRAEAEVLFGSLHIGYTQFFRNPFAFDLLGQVLLPRQVSDRAKAGHSEFRVWSACCAAGQEAWSIAILLDEVTGAESCPLGYRIFATDLSEPDLTLARAGVYSADAVDNLRLRQLRRYFVRHDDSYAICQRLRDRVSFATYDLLDTSSGCPSGSIYGDFDLVFCCNLLFYYRPDIRRRILDKLCRALSPGGYFVTGEAEREIVLKCGSFDEVGFMTGVFQKGRNHI